MSSLQLRWGRKARERRRRVARRRN